VNSAVGMSWARKQNKKIAEFTGRHVTDSR
jgi:hypothetical protein